MNELHIVIIGNCILNAVLWYVVYRLDTDNSYLKQQLRKNYMYIKRLKAVAELKGCNLDDVYED